MAELYHIAIKGEAIIAISIGTTPIKLHVTSTDGTGTKKTAVFNYEQRGGKNYAMVDVGTPGPKVGDDVKPTHTTTTGGKLLKRKDLTIGSTTVAFLDPDGGPGGTEMP